MCVRLFQISLLVFLTRRCLTFSCHGNKVFSLLVHCFFFFNRALLIITLFLYSQSQYAIYKVVPLLWRILSHVIAIH
jgi:hypothetical protein